VKVEAIQETARQYNTNPKWGEVITWNDWLWKPKDTIINLN
jgi:hypothetical protein